MALSKLFLTLLACAAFAAGAALAEVIPGKNVNMVSGTSWPDGDPFLRQQNEGAMAASTRNPLHLLAGGNDYRTVDIPGLPDGKVTGDAWMGVFWSRDGGHKWQSTLLPGYLQDNSPAGLASPLKGLEAGADAVVRAGTNGLMFYAGIAFNREAIPENAHGTTGKTGKLFVARFIDDNAKETGIPFRNLGTTVADQGNQGRFLDKPWLAVDVPRQGAATCLIPASGQIAAQSFPAGNVYLSYTVFVGGTNNIRTKVLFTRSQDCGKTWSNATKLSEGLPISQGTVIAVHPLTGAVYVAWRQIDPEHHTAAFTIAKSTDGGQSFTKPIEIAALAPYTLSDLVTQVSSVFEQGTSLVSFRTTGFPALAVDASGVVYAAWSERGRGPGADARIVLKRSPDGIDWSAPAVTVNGSLERGHELMPSLLFHGGKVLLLHYNLVEDHTVGLLTPAGGGAFTETRDPAGDLALPAPEPGKVFREFVADTAPGGLKRRHTIDVWVREASPVPLPSPLGFTSSRVSQYVYGDVGSGEDAGKIKQFQFNPPNLPLFSCKGELINCRAFFSDYIDLAGAPAFLPSGTVWTYNLDPATASTAHAVWTDNRDVRPPPPGKTWADYTPPNSPFSANLPPESLFDPSQQRPVCVPEADGFTTSGMRNQNLYTSRLTKGLVASSPQNAKPLGFGVLPDGTTVLLQRSFVAVVQNTSDTARTFRLSIRNQPPGGKASFLQFPTSGFPDPLTELFLNVAPKSSATRTVFVTSTNPDASVTVDVQEATAPGGDVIPPEAGGLQTVVVLNPDITNPDITNPDITNPDITNPDITNAEVYNPDITNPDITNPDITNPDITNPDITNPDITNPDITNPDITNAQVYNPDITNPDITNPDITNPDITNPDITNPDITNVSPDQYTDATWTIKDNGNTSAGYKVKLLSNAPLPPGFKAQLIIHGGYSTPVPLNCDLGVQRQSIVIANIPDPVFVSPLSPDITNTEPTNPDITNATLFVAPGDDWAQITLRLFDPVPGDAVTAEDVINGVTPVVISQAVNTIEAALGSRTPSIAVPTTTIVFLEPPVASTAGVPLTPIVRVQARDNTGAVLPGVAVTLSFGSNPTGATLSGNVAASNVTGIAQFPGLTIDRAGVYTLVASAGNLPPALSAPFTILPAPPRGFTKIWIGGAASGPTSWSQAANWNPPGVPTSTEDTYVAPAPNQPVLTASESTRKLTVASGATLGLDVFTLNTSGDVDVSGTMTGTGALRMVPVSLAALRGTVPNLQIEGPVAANGAVSVVGNLGVFKTGEFSPADQVVGVGGNLTTFGAGTLRMTSGNALLDVVGNATFAGGSTARLLTDGTLRVNGNFNQDGGTSTESFAASSNHRTILAGPGTSVQFANPGDTAGTSHFHTLRIDVPGDVSLLSDVYGIGPLVTTGPTPPIVLGGGHRLTFQGLNVFRLVLDDAPLVSNLGSLQRFDDVTFQSYAAATPLTIINQGQAAPFTLDNLDFGLPTAAVLLAADDPFPAGTIGFTLHLELTRSLPADGCRLVTSSGEASVSWNAVPCP